jgi:hypothetical protein
MAEKPQLGGALPALPLAELLSLLRPTPADTTVLRACLFTDERGRLALESWTRHSSVSDLFAVRWNRLFPLLAEAVRRFGISLRPAVRSRLRAALASEEMRYEAYIRALCPALTGLKQEGLTPIVLKGAALAEGVYPRAALRHSHDVDLLFAKDERAAAIDVLGRHGWSRTAIEATAGTSMLIHSCGLPLGVHTRLVRGALQANDFAQLRARGREFSVADVQALTLSPEDSLVNILGQAVTSGTFPSLQWVSDAFYCLQRAGSFDWPLFLGELTKIGLATACIAPLWYLREAIELPVPDEADDLVRLAGATGWAEREALIAFLDAGGLGRRRMWSAAKGWETRAVLLKWLLLPRRDLADAILPSVPLWRIPLRNVKRAAIGSTSGSPLGDLQRLSP